MVLHKKLNTSLALALARKQNTRVIWRHCCIKHETLHEYPHSSSSCIAGRARFAIRRGAATGPFRVAKQAACVVGGRSFVHPMQTELPKRPHALEAITSFFGQRAPPLGSHLLLQLNII